VEPSETETPSEPVKPGETETMTETVGSSETETSTETVAETEEAGETSATAETETETEIETETEQMTADAEELVTVKAHFKNVTGWEEVALHHWGGGIDGTVWPGIDVTEKDQDGYYIVEIPNVKRSEELGIIFNNKNGSQTGDIKIPASEFTSETYEVWAWVDEANGTGWSAEPLVSPAIERNTVTFRYMNVSAETVLVAGSMNDWTADPESEKAIKMTKGEDGIFTYKTKLQRGDYEYKFVVLGEGDPKWTADPKNSKKENGNSAFSLTTLLSPEIKGYDATFYYESDVETVLVAGSMNSWTEDPESAKAAKMTRNADGLLTYTFTSLEPGDYTYKFIEFVGESKNWITDPNNDLIADDGFGGKNSLFTIGEDISKTYEYTIHYYNPAVTEPVLEEPDLLIWNGNASSSTGKPYLFTEMLDDTENGIKWLTMTVKVPYKKVGMNGRPRAGKTKKDADRTYTIADGDKAELWYVYGKGIYEKKPAFGKVEKAEASLLSDSMNYTQNNVLSLKLTGVDDVPVTGHIREAYVDASDLGMSSKLYIDPELLAVTLSVRENVAAGTYTLPVTVKDFYNNVIETSVNVEITSKSDNDFDWDEAVIYFMVTDRFFDGNADNNAANGAETFGKDNAGLYHGGDFAGVTQKLDYLKDLGVNTIWITPIVDNISGVTVDGDGKEDVPFNAAYHGYWASDFTKLDPALGTEDELKTLISAAHDKGIKIMVDVVLNHAGYGQEEYFNSLLKDAEGNPIQMIRDDSQQVSGSDQQASLSGLPDFLTENEAVRNQLVQWQVDWMKNYDIDYFRVDTVKHVDSTTWSAFKNELTKANPAFKMIGEYYGAGHSWNGGSLGSGQMDSVLDFNFNDYATDFVKGNLSSVENNLRDRNRTLNNTYMTGQFLSSHDEEGFKQNLLNQRWEQQAADAAALVAATLQITAKGQPVIYYGEEIGQTGKNNYPYQTNRYDFDWNAATSENSVYSHYNTLLKIRNQYTDLFSKGDRQSVAVSDAEGYDVVSRSCNGETIYIGMNIKGEAKTITIPVNNNGVNAYEDLYSKTKSGANQKYEIQDGKIEITIPAAKDGGTVILVPASFTEGLIAPQLTLIKGRENELPSQLVKMSADGQKTKVDVTYTMTAANGATLDDKNKTLKLEDTFKENVITLTAAAGSDKVEFQSKVFTDNNKITLQIHYHREDGNYEGWNVWGWRTGAGGEGYEFVDDNGEKIVTIELDDARANSDYNYIVRKREGDNDWADKNDPNDQKIDLSDVLSGTVHFYIEGGKPNGKRVLGDDVLTGAKVLTADYDTESGHIICDKCFPLLGV
ncbi:MAG: starch-binding protein, partial [Lachnospiraceae bacterium]|nr:starch-binding protein [Lachnospiraceae bacterium]